MYSVDLISAPIGLGPFGKAQAFGKAIAKKAKVRFVTDAEFGKNSVLNSKLNASDAVTCKRGQWDKLLRSGEMPDILVSFMEPSAIEPYSNRGIQTVFFNSLHCFERSEDARLSACNLTIQQCFAMTANERAQNQDSAAQHGFRLCAPLVEPHSGKMRSFLPEAGETHIVVHLGGLRTPYVSKREMDKIGFEIAKIALLALRDWPFDHITFAGAISGRLQDVITREIDQKLVPSFDFVRRRDVFLDRLWRASLILTTPGLETIFEATVLDLPVVLLPPVNYSQAHQSRSLTREGIPTLVGENRLYYDLDSNKNWRHFPLYLARQLESALASSVELAGTQRSLNHIDWQSAIRSQKMMLKFSSSDLPKAEEVFLEFLECQ